MEDLKLKNQSARLWKIILNFKLKFLVLLFAFLILVPCNALGVDKKQQLQFTKDPQIQQVKPNKPVKIKLKRSAKGEYSWDLVGDSVDEVVKVDKRLRKLLNIE